MGAGINPGFNPRTGTYERPKMPYESRRSKKKKEGCYIATSVYGSYDCPEVWALRRYRDYHLASSIGGRLFIKSYYAISPTIVRIFGEKDWFNKFFKRKLDYFVGNLILQGYSTEKYEDYSK